MEQKSKDCFLLLHDPLPSGVSPGLPPHIAVMYRIALNSNYVFTPRPKQGKQPIWGTLLNSPKRGETER
jgi:hypothetical protein